MTNIRTRLMVSVQRSLSSIVMKLAFTTKELNLDEALRSIYDASCIYTSVITANRNTLMDFYLSGNAT